MKIEDIFTFDPFNQKILDELCANIDRIVPFVGAGLSACVFPTWSRLLQDFGKLVSQPDIFNADDNIENASRSRDNSGKITFSDYIKNVYSTSKIQSSSQIIETSAVWLLPTLFQGLIMTTNYDQLLEYVYSRQFPQWTIPVCHPGHREALNESIRMNTCLIYKIHGSITEPSNLVMTEESYLEAYKDGSAVREDLTFCYRARPLLFLGCSLNEDWTLKLWDSIDDAGLYNYAILECTDENRGEKRQLFSNRNIKLILYPEGQYGYVKCILEYMILKSGKIPPALYYSQFPSSETGLKIISDKNKINRTNHMEKYIPCNLKLQEEVISAAQLSAQLYKTNKLVILGEPGSGKTMLLNALYIELLDCYEQNTSSHPFPLLVSMSKWRDEETVFDFVKRHFKSDYDIITMLKNGRVILLLDGLNELSTPNKIQSLQEWFLSDAVPNYIVATCRTEEEYLTYLPDISIARLLPLTGEQKRNLIRKYLPDDTLFENRLKLHEDALGEYFFIWDTPFYLVSLIKIYKDSPDQSIPVTAGDVLRILTNQMWTNKYSKSVYCTYYEKVRGILSQLAIYLTQNRKLSIDYDEAVSALSEVPDAPMLLELAHKANLIYYQNSMATFEHQLFLEYYAAYYFIDCIQNSDPASFAWAVQKILLKKSGIAQERCGPEPGEPGFIYGPWHKYDSRIYRPYYFSIQEQWKVPLYLALHLAGDKIKVFEDLFYIDFILCLECMRNCPYPEGILPKVRAKIQNMIAQGNFGPVLLDKILPIPNLLQLEPLAQFLSPLNYSKNGLPTLYTHTSCLIELFEYAEYRSEEISGYINQLICKESIDPVTKITALKASGILGNLETARILIERFVLNDTNLRWTSNCGIHPDSIDANTVVYPALIQLCRRFSGETAERLMQAYHPYWNRHIEIIKVLGTAQLTQALPLLISALHDSDEGVRQAAAYALGLLKCQEAIPHLYQALSDAENVKAAAITALGFLQDKNIMVYLIDTLRSYDNGLSDIQDDVYERKYYGRIFNLTNKSGCEFHIGDSIKDVCLTALSHIAKKYKSDVWDALDICMIYGPSDFYDRLIEIKEKLSSYSYPQYLYVPPVYSSDQMLSKHNGNQILQHITRHRNLWSFDWEGFWM